MRIKKEILRLQERQRMFYNWRVTKNTEDLCARCRKNESD